MMMLPAGPLAVKIVEIAEREESFGLPPLTIRRATDSRRAAVCMRAGITMNTLLRWRRNMTPTLSPWQADSVLQALDLLWWEVWPPEEFPEVAREWESEAVA